MATFVTRQRQTSGVPMGGLGTGSIELCPDGEFHRWQIANPERWRQDSRERPQADDGEGLAGSLSFYVRSCSDGGGATLRRLGLGLGSGQGTEEYNYRMYSFNKPVEQIVFDGRFPLVSLSYEDSALPLDIRLQAASPFVPYDERTAGTPGVYLTFLVRNRSAGPVDVSLAGKLRVLASAGPEGRGRRVSLQRGDGRTTVQIGSGSTVPSAPDRGSAALSLEADDVSWLAGEYRGFMDEYVAHGELSVTEESFLFGLRQGGRLPDLAVEERPDWRDALARADSLTEDETARLLGELEHCGFARSILERLRLISPALFDDSASRRTVLRYLLQNWSELDEKDPWGDAALCASFRLQPGEQRQVRFILGWYFPELCSANGRSVGHMYENWFSDAAAVCSYLSRERTRILSAAERFRDALYDTSFPCLFPDVVSAHLSTMVKCSWWSREGDFGIWEGLGSCGLHTTDVSYHGTHGLLALFPALQLRQMRMTAAFQRPDGRIPHFFTPDFKSVDNGFERVDMNPQFVLLVCRDYLATGDRDYAAEMWPYVELAMELTEGLDSDGDGLPDRDAEHNTYDAWCFSGASAYVSVLWLAALEAAAVLAELCGHPKQAAHWRQTAGQSAHALEEKLWNGEYYDLWVDGSARDECCMTDQLDGALFARLTGLGNILPDGRVRQTLDSVWRYNRSEENGLVNASCPSGKRCTLHTFRNCQGLANWSGIEYLTAAFYIMTGRYDRGLALVQGVFERHERLGQLWDHAECGDYYYRPLSSWVLLQALSGVSYQGAGDRLLLGPAAVDGDFHGLWASPAGYGQVSGRPGGRLLTCLQGEIPVGCVSLHGKKHIERIALDGAPLPFGTRQDAGQTEALFSRVILRECSALEITFSL